jgi:KTSC domain
MTDPTTTTEAHKHSTIALTLTPDSSKVHGYGYVPETQTLAVRFKGFKDSLPDLYTYEYPNTTADEFAALEAADSKGGHINKVFVFTKRPFNKLLAEAPAAPAAAEAVA